MVVNLRSCLSLAFLFFITSCISTPEPVEKEQKNQLVIVLDKSASVTYNNKLDNIESELKRNFQEIYGRSRNHIQLSKFVISGDTRIFPEPVRFSTPCPNPNPESRSEVEAFQNWQVEKNKWISNQIKHTVDHIKKEPYSSSTDVFAIFSGLEQVQRVDGPWDKIKVLVFSDMIHTVSGHNMKAGLTESNSLSKGKEECRILLNNGTIKKGSLENVYLTIYTPDNMPESGLISTFWRGFFEEWGLPESQYHFEY
jgi:hypothetical protein